MSTRAVLASLAVLGAIGSVGAADTFEQAIRESDFIVDTRVRYEHVNEDGFAEKADAATIRLRLGFETAPWRKTALLVEEVWVDDLVDDYNSTTNGHSQFPVVPDPADFAALNRFAVINNSLTNTTLTLGRQRITLDDQRFVGNGAWRQNEQTFDALRIQTGSARIKADVTYASRVNRVFGPDSPAGEWEGDILLANLSHTFPIGALTVFSYFIDLDNAAASSGNTVGARFAGTRAIGKIGGRYALSYARQSDAGENPASFSEDYYLAEGGLDFKKFGVTLGYEVLGGNGVAAFQTPIATLHPFQGWADKFTTTPPEGIEDHYVSIAYTIASRGKFTIGAVATFHDVLAEQGPADFGQELDLQIVARAERATLTLKHADYRAKQLFTDTVKVWVSVDYAF